MKRILIGVTLSLTLPFAATAQTAPASKAPAAALTAAAPTAAADTAINADTPIETAMASPSGKAAMEKTFPDIPGHPAYEQFKGMSLRQLQPLAGGLITDEKIAAFEAAARTK